MISKITSMSVVVLDAQESATWFREKLGWEAVGDPGEHWVVAYPEGRGDGAHLHLCAGFYPLEPGNSGIAFATPDLQTAYEGMHEKGVEFTQEPTKEDWGFYAMFKDPDGNEFWLFEE